MPQIDPNLTLLLIALFNLITALLAWRTHATSKETQAKVAATQSNIQKIETATNSMKDALVQKTGEAAHAAGLEEGRVAGEAKAAVLAEGKLQQP